MATATASKNGTVAAQAVEFHEIPSLNIQLFKLTLGGDSPLIMHRWSEKARREIEDKQAKKPQKAREKRDPKADYEASFYQYGPDGKDPRDGGTGPWDGKSYGFPSVAFKAAAVSAATFLDKSVTKVMTRGLFHIPGELVLIEGEPRMRTDMVRVGMGSADIRYRAEFPVWKATLNIRYNASVTNPGQIANLFNIAGFAIGVGDWRPEKDGSYGMFHVEGELDDSTD